MSKPTKKLVISLMFVPVYFGVLSLPDVVDISRLAVSALFGLAFFAQCSFLDLID